MQQYGQQGTASYGGQMPSAYGSPPRQQAPLQQPYQPQHNGSNPQQVLQQQQIYQQQHQQQQQQQYAHSSRYQQEPPSQYNQQTYGQQMYTGSREGQSSQGVAGGAGGVGGKKQSIFTLDFVKSKWQRFFFAVTAVQAILCLVFEAYVFARFQDSLGPRVSNERADAQYKTIPTFLTLFIFGFLYELVVVWDALRMKNTIQVIGVCIANLALLVYTAIQVDQILEAIQVLRDFQGALNKAPEAIWDEIRGFLTAIPCMIAVATLAMGFGAWKLYQEFAWDILKHIGADYRMKKRFLHYQIYIALLKFDFFFFLGFMVQFLVVVNNQPEDSEFGLTIAVIPITIVILLAAAFFARKENKYGMMFIMVCYLGALTYFIFKLVRIYQPRTADVYRPVRKSLTAFSVITILLILLTIANAVICLRNFGAGLKQHLVSSRAREEEKNPDLNSINMNELKQPQVPSRMTID